MSQAPSYQIGSDSSEEAQPSLIKLLSPRDSIKLDFLVILTNIA